MQWEKIVQGGSRHETEKNDSNHPNRGETLLTKVHAPLRRKMSEKKKTKNEYPGIV